MLGGGGGGGWWGVVLGGGGGGGGWGRWRWVVGVVVCGGGRGNRARRLKDIKRVSISTTTDLSNVNRHLTPALHARPQGGGGGGGVWGRGLNQGVSRFITASRKKGKGRKEERKGEGGKERSGSEESRWGQKGRQNGNSSLSCEGFGCRPDQSSLQRPGEV